MTKLLSLLVSLTILASCASKPPPAPPEAETGEEKNAPEEETFVTVEKAYKKYLIMDGAQPHQVKWGDTLSGLSEQYYGHSAYFPLIALASDETSENVDLIITGKTLYIPNLEVNRANSESHEQLRQFFEKIAVLLEQKGRQKDAQAVRTAARDW